MFKQHALKTRRKLFRESKHAKDYWKVTITLEHDAFSDSRQKRLLKTNSKFEF